MYFNTITAAKLSTSIVSECSFSIGCTSELFFVDPVGRQLRVQHCPTRSAVGLEQAHKAKATVDGTDLQCWLTALETRQAVDIVLQRTNAVSMGRRRFSAALILSRSGSPCRYPNFCFVAEMGVVATDVDG